MKKQLTAVAVLSWTLLCSVPGRAEQSPKNWPAPMHDNVVLTKVMLDRLEARDTDSGNLFYWEAQAWVGGDINKLWLKTEGERLKGSTEDAELEVFYSRAVAPFWDIQAGMRHELKVNDKSARNWIAFGVEGLAPYRFEVDATGYVGENGRTAARLKAEYDLLITQRLVLMPELEFNLYGKEDPERGIGSGLSNVDLSLRVRYEIKRELAPYAGIVWTHKYGGTANFARADGERTQEAQYVVGVRSWF
jgi:copper resistance protein B